MFQPGLKLLCIARPPRGGLCLFSQNPAARSLTLRTPPSSQALRTLLQSGFDPHSCPGLHCQALRPLLFFHFPSPTLGLLFPQPALQKGQCKEENLQHRSFQVLWCFGFVPIRRVMLGHSKIAEHEGFSSMIQSSSQKCLHVDLPIRSFLSHGLFFLK